MEVQLQTLCDMYKGSFSVTGEQNHGFIWLCLTLENPFHRQGQLFMHGGNIWLRCQSHFLFLCFDKDSWEKIGRAWSITVAPVVSAPVYEFIVSTSSAYLNVDQARFRTGKNPHQASVYFFFFFNCLHFPLPKHLLNNNENHLAGQAVLNYIIIY